MDDTHVAMTLYITLFPLLPLPVYMLCVDIYLSWKEEEQVERRKLSKALEVLLVLDWVGLFYLRRHCQLLIVDWINRLWLHGYIYEKAESWGRIDERMDRRIDGWIVPSL